MDIKNLMQCTALHEATVDLQEAINDYYSWRHCSYYNEDDNPLSAEYVERVEKAMATWKPLAEAWSKTPKRILPQ